LIPLKNLYLIYRLYLSPIAALLDELAAIDYATKTGQAQAPVAIEQLVVKLAGTGTPDRRTIPSR
jgi:DNA polymerase III delta subunit